MKKDLLLKISNYSYFLMMFFLPISLLLDNIFLIIMFLSIIFNKKKAINNNNVLYYLLAFFLFTLVNGFLNNSFLVEKSNYIKLLPFIFIPFCLDNIENKIKLKGFVFLIIGIIIIQLNSVYGIINYYYFTEGKKYALKNYSKINEILNYERPYLGFFSALSIVICFYYYSINKNKILSTIISFFSLLLIIVISARLAIVIVFFTSLVVIFKKLNKKNFIKTLIIFLGIIFLIFMSNSSLNDRFSEIKKDARVITWKGASVTFFKNAKFIFGTGSEENTRSNLLEYYKNYDGFISKDEKNRFINKNYNTHNQYINELLRGGVIGLLLLLIPQVILLYSSFKKNNILELMFLVSIFSFCLVENILDRQVGVYLYALLLSLTNIPYKVNK